MFPSAPLHITDEPKNSHHVFKKRREWLMGHSTGPIVLVAPKFGPNQSYSWANCYQPVYQDSYILYLTGINQTNIAIVLDPTNNQQHIFLPDYDKHRVFWDGEFFAHGDSTSHAFLSNSGFDHIKSIQTFNSFLKTFTKKKVTWHMLLEKNGAKFRRNDTYKLKQYLQRINQGLFECNNISDLSWKQRLVHDGPAILSLKSAIEKTNVAFKTTIQSAFKSESELSGQLIGNLLKETPFGLSFSPIIAKNENAGILHYNNNSAKIKPNDLILMDFGLRWNSMCTDISRTIPANGKYSTLQKLLMNIVIKTQDETIKRVRPGVTFNELNEFAWSTLEEYLERDFITKGGKMTRLYKKQPHNIGHFLGIQVHDGDSNRNYRSQPLKEYNVLTIEPGLYGEFQINGEKIHCGIRIEDNLLVTKKGVQNLTESIPKTCEEIEFIMAN